MKKQLSLAYYLPQFHEIKENNLWWGEGFTEWTNINNAKKYFPSHNIRIPNETLGQYNLLDIEVLEKQYALASAHGINGFLVWNYWFGEGEKILEKPIEAILEHDIDFKFCFAWANHSWMNKSKGILLKEQKYLGVHDYEDYFEYLLPYFKNKNYIKIDGKPVFSIFKPQDIPDLKLFIDIFHKLSVDNGFNGIYFIAEHTDSNAPYLKLFDRFCDSSCYLKNRYKDNIFTYIKEKLANKLSLKKLGPFVYNYHNLTQGAQKETHEKYIPIIFTGWDTTPRHDKRGLVLDNFNINTFNDHLQKINKEYPNADILIIKSWNEWAEGNLLEPDNINKDKLLKLYMSFSIKIEG